MAFQANMSREHQLWSLHDLSDQVKAKDTDMQKKFQRTIRSFSRQPMTQVPEEWRELVDSQSCALMQANTTRLDTSMVYLREYQGIKLYEKTSTENMIVQGATTVAGTVESILQTLRMNSSKEFNDTVRTLLPSIVCQGATIATENDLHVHWMSFVGLSDQHKLSDLTFISSTQFYEAQEDGLPVPTTESNHVYCGTHVWESIQVPELGMFQPDDTKCERREITNSGFFVETSEIDDVCRVTFTLCLNGVASCSHPSTWMETVVVTALQQLMLSCRTKHLQLIPREKWAHDNHCHLCAKSFRFNVLRRRHHCRLCGQSICNACSTFVTMDTVDTPVPNRPKSSPVESVRSCLLCAFTEKPLTKNTKPSSAEDPTANTRPSRISQAPTTASSFRDSVLSKHDSVPSMVGSPVEGGHRRSLAGPEVVVPPAQASPMVHSTLTRNSSLQYLSKTRDPSMSSRYRRRSLQEEMYHGAEDNLTMSSHGDLRISERQARCAAMLERSHTFLESAMSTSSHRRSVELPRQQKLSLLQELGVVQAA